MREGGVGLHSSATIRTVNTAKAMIEKAAGPGPPLFQVVMERRHCMVGADVSEPRAYHLALHGTCLQGRRRVAVAL